MMEVTVWSSSIVIFKVLIYLISAIAIGTESVRLFARISELSNSINMYWNKMVLAGAIVFVVYFLLQVGSFAEEGFIGMFNWAYAEMLWQSSIGEALLFQLCGLTVVFSGRLVFDQNKELLRKIHYLFFFVGVALIARSYSLVGHTAEQNIIFQLLLSTHFICIAWWVGALFPLRSACGILREKELFSLMDQFGRLASFVVAVLIASGIVLVFLFSKGKLDIFTSSYGIILLGKLFLVSLILLIALYHKLKLVPAIGVRINAASLLKISITREIILALLILMITALLTTIAGISI